MFGGTHINFHVWHIVKFCMHTTISRYINFP